MMDRYIRNLQLEGFDGETQERLRRATVAIVGAGALGSVVAMYLAAAGVGRLRIADFDTIDITNLQRQVFYSESDAGELKVEVLSRRLRALNSEVTVEPLKALVTRADVADFISGSAVIAECSDNPPTKEMIVDEGVGAGIPVVAGGVREYAGQVSVFAPGGDAPRFADLFPTPQCRGVMPCSAGGVFSPVPGIVASLQASEILKIAGRLPGAMSNQLLTFDVRSMDFRKFQF